MKRCPQCGRNYSDETLNFCLDDGVALLDGPSSAEPATEMLLDDPSSESRTRTYGDRRAKNATDVGTKADRVEPSAKRNLLIAGAFGVVLLTALGIGGYWFYQKPSSK